MSLDLDSMRRQIDYEDRRFAGATRVSRARKLLAEVERLSAQITAVLALHRRNGEHGWCRDCGGLWPCATARALGVQANESIGSDNRFQVSQR